MEVDCPSKVVAYQYRYLEQNEHCVDYNRFGPWKNVTEAEAQSIRQYIEEGYSYELRELGQLSLLQGGNCKQREKHGT